MTREELEKDYYSNRPTEPYSDNEKPNDWANIAHYAEENLEKAFKRITELEQQIEQLTYLHNEDISTIKSLNKQIAILKKCEDCKNREYSAHEEPCLHCQRCFASKDVKDQENVKDNWDLLRELE